MLLRAITVLGILAFAAFALSANGFYTKAKVSAGTRPAPKRFRPLSLAMKAKGPSKSKPQPLDAVTLPPLNTAIWIKLSGDFGEKVFSVKSNSDSANIDDLKELVKVKCPILLNEIDAMMLEIKSADGSVLRPGILLASRPEGKTDLEPFNIELPDIGK